MELLATISDTCSDAALARGITIIHTVMTWICIIVPILLILSLAISLLSMTIDPNQKDGMKKIYSSYYYFPYSINIKCCDVFS